MVVTVTVVTVGAGGKTVTVVTVAKNPKVALKDSLASPTTKGV